MKKGLIIVVSGPSGAGKGTICAALKDKMPELKHSVSVTTRAPRKGEKEGVNYYYKTMEEYQQMIAKGEFLETAEVYKNYYGTPKAPVFEMLKAGHDVLFELDTLGAAQMKKSYPECVCIFIMTPSFEDLEKRLVLRGTESADSLKRRLAAAKLEFKKYAMYDYLVVNDDVDKATEKLFNIIKAEKCSMARNKSLVNAILE